MGAPIHSQRQAWLAPVPTNASHRITSAEVDRGSLTGATIRLIFWIVRTFIRIGGSMSRRLRRLLLVLLVPATASEVHAQKRLLQPEDLFRVERVGTIALSPDQSRAAVEIHRPSRWLDRSIPTADIAVLDVASATLRVISPSLSNIVGCFRPAWSPDNRRLLFLSVDSNAVVRPWLWTVDGGPPTLLDGLELHDSLADPPVGMWSDAEHAVFMVRDSASPNDGPLYSAIHRARNVADQWARTRRRTRSRRVRARLSRRDRRYHDGCWNDASIANRLCRRAHSSCHDDRNRGATPTHAFPRRSDPSYRRENPPFPAAPVATFFGPNARGDAVYDDVNGGSEVHHVDVRTW